MSQKLPVNAFKCVEKASQLNEHFIKNYNEESDVGYFLMFITLKITWTLQWFALFVWKNENWEGLKNL